MTASLMSSKSNTSRSCFVIKHAMSFLVATTLTLSGAILLKIFFKKGAAILEVKSVASPVTLGNIPKNSSYSSFAKMNGAPIVGSDKGVPVTLRLYSELISFTSSSNSRGS